MQTIKLFITACLILLISCAGCRTKPETVQTHEPEVLTLKRKNVQLRKAKEDLERRNIILKDRVASLSQREQKLSKTVTEQKFELEQLQRQVDTLADVPRQRDQYKQQVEQLKAEVDKLKSQLRKDKK